MAYRGQQKKPVALPEIYSTSPAGSLGPAGAEEHREEVDSGGVKEATVTNATCSVSGDSNHVLAASIPNEGRSIPLAGNLQPPPTVISCTMSINEVADCLIQHNCKDITSEFDFEGYSPILFGHHGPGTIHRGQLRCGQPVAIKCIEAPGHWESWRLQKKSIKHAAHELYAWSKCNHPNILKPLGFATFGGHILLVSPWMKNGSLVHYLDENPQSDRLKLTVELSSALAYLHSMGIVHGDIKADNVIISDDGHAQLGDFGSAILLNYSSINFTETGFKGTLRFTAPELLDWEKGKKPTVKSDIYALGMTILQIMTGKLPYADQPNHTVPNEVLVKKKTPERPNLSRIFASLTAEEELWCLLTRCWDHESDSRPNVMEVKEILVGLERFALQTAKSDASSEAQKPAVSALRNIPWQSPPRYSQTSNQAEPFPPNAAPTSTEINQASFDNLIDTPLSNSVNAVSQQAAQLPTSPTVVPGSGPVPYLIGAAVGMAAGITVSSLSSLIQRPDINRRQDRQTESKHHLINEFKKGENNLIAPAEKVQPPSSAINKNLYDASRCFKDYQSADSTRLVPLIFTQTYPLSRGYGYMHQLDSWCDRIGVGRIRFVASNHSHNQYQIFPIFPEVIHIGSNYAAIGRSKQEAYLASLSRIPQAAGLDLDSIQYEFGYSLNGFVARPCLVKYGKYSPLTQVVGFGVSLTEAKEKAAETLLRSKQYCFI